MGTFIQENLPILALSGTIIIYIIRQEGKVLNLKNSTKEKIDAVEKRLDTLEDQHAIIEQMALDVREVKTDMKWLKNNTSV